MLLDILQSLVDGLIDGSLIAVAAIGLSLVFSVQRFANVSQAGMLSAGAYLTLIGTGLGLSFWLAAVFAVFWGGVLGVLVFLLAFRPLRRSTRVTLLVASIGVDLIVRYGIALGWGRNLRGFPLENLGSFMVGEIQVGWVGLGIFVASILTMVFVQGLLHYTRIGREMRAVADLPELARMSHISEMRVYTWSWALVGATAAIAGICLALRSSIYPDIGWDALLVAFAAAVFGGLGEIRGAVLGGFVMGITGSLVTLYISPTFKPAFGFLIMALVLLFRPWGLLGKRGRV